MLQETAKWISIHTDVLKGENVPEVCFYTCLVLKGSGCCSEQSVLRNVCDVRRSLCWRSSVRSGESDACGRAVARDGAVCCRVMCLGCYIVVRCNCPNVFGRSNQGMWWTGHVARMKERRGAHRDLVGKPEGRRPFGRSRRRWEDRIKMDLQEIRWGLDWLLLWTGRWTFVP